MPVNLTSTATNALKAVLLDGAKDLFAQARVGAARSVDTAGFIAGPVPDNPFLAYQHRLGRSVCDRWARVGRDEILPGDDLILRESCALYLGADAPGAPVTGIPFTGGQCFGSLYNVSGLRQVGTNPAVTISAANQPGPIGGMFQRIEGTLSRIFVVRGTATPGIQEEFLVNESSIGDNISSFGSVTVTRVSGLDNCGNPPPQFDAGSRNLTADPNPGPVGGPTGYPFPNLDISINPDGSIRFDFGDGAPPETVKPSDPEGTGEPVGGGGVDGSDLVPSGGAAGTAVDAPNGGTADGAAPPGKELVGIRVQVLQAPFGANEYANNPAQIFRGIGYVRMGYPDNLALDLGGAAVISPQFFIAPVRGLTNWEVRANLGFINRVTPFYRDLPS